MASLSHANNLKPLKNASIVGFGKGMQGLVSLISLALAARHLGVETFGFFVLIHGMVFGFSQILRFQSWQAVLKYGAHAQADDDPARLTTILRFTFTLDFLSAVIGTIIMVCLAGPLAKSFSLPDDHIWMAQLYSVSLAFMLLTPTQLGVLRLFDRFDLVAIQTLIGPLFRFLGTLILFFVFPQSGLFAYLCVWFCGGFFARQFMFIFAQYVLRQHNFKQSCFRLVHPFKPPQPGMWSFIFGHNVFRSFYISHEYIGLMVVGWLLGPAAAGLFRIAQKIAAIMIKPTEKLLVPALYPELAKFEATGDKVHRNQMIKSNLKIVGVLSFLLFAILCFGGKEFIILLSGSEYERAYSPMIWLCIAGLVTILSYPLEPLLSAAGRIRQLVISYGAGFVVYVVSLIILTLQLHITGAAIATLLAVSVSTFFMYVLRPKRHTNVSYNNNT